MPVLPITGRPTYRIDRCVVGFSLKKTSENIFQAFCSPLDQGLNQWGAGGGAHPQGSHLSEISLCFRTFLATFFFDVCLI